MSVGAFAAFIGLLMAAGQSLRQVTNLQTVMVEGLTAARRLFAALDIQPEIRETPDATPFEHGPTTLAFDRVSFAYSPASESAAPTLYTHCVHQRVNEPTNSPISTRTGQWSECATSGSFSARMMPPASASLTLM